MAERVWPGRLPAIDWRVAAATGRLLAPAGPQVSRGEAADAVADLRACATRATDAVAAVSGLSAALPAEVLVLGRSGWIEAATAMTAAMLHSAGQAPAVTPLERLAAGVAGGQLGAALAFVATRILGQFDPYSASPRLLLIAPNIVATERTLRVEPHGFRLWVCLHEQTHQLQFGAAPWLARHLLNLLGEVLDGAPGALDRMTAVMSLLEGHANVVMDAAGADLVPQAAQLRAAFDTGRNAGGLVEVMTRVFGLRAKREQYLRGAGFCRAVLAEGGFSALNHAFDGPASLPTAGELAEPAAWLRRVPGRAG